jgi:ribosomal-protein-alanine N-acetyltransferase
MNIILKTNRLQMRQFKILDINEYFEVLQDENLYKYLPEKVPSLLETEKYIKWFIDRDNKNSNDNFIGTNLAVTLNNKIIGWCGLQPFDPIPNEIELFYGLSSKYWNNGYMSEAASSVINFGFKLLKLKKIVAGVKENNIPSMKILEKIGFKFVKKITNLQSNLDFYNNEYYYELINNG